MHGVNNNGKFNTQELRENSGFVTGITTDIKCTSAKVSLKEPLQGKR